MLQLSEILGRKIAVTTFGNLWFPKTHDMLVNYLEVLNDRPEFEEFLKKQNTNTDEWIKSTNRMIDQISGSMKYTEEEVANNLKLGKVPYMFNATEVFEMEMENLKDKIIDNGGSENIAYDLLQLCSDIYNENNIFLTQPYEDNFYMLDGNQKLNTIIDELFLDEDTREDAGVPKFKDISVIVRQFDLDEPIENDQHRWWVVKDNLAKDPAYKNVPPRELFNHPDYEKDNQTGYKDFVLEMPSMPYIADDVKPKYVQFIDIFGRRFCCDDPKCNANGSITWINNVQICLDNYGRPYSLVSYHDMRQSDDEINIYSTKYTNAQASMSAGSHALISTSEACFEGAESGEYVDEWKRVTKNAKAEAVHMYLSTAIITHSVIGGLLRVTQWLNGDNGDVFTKEDTPVDRQERKRIKRTDMGQNTENDEPTLTIKTLKVRPSLYVVEPDGTERKLNPRELAQHTRRGHFRHYGINGKGLLFGKLVKSVYIKPTTVGKIEHGLVIKDYELEGRDSVDV